MVSQWFFTFMSGAALFSCFLLAFSGSLQAFTTSNVHLSVCLLARTKKMLSLPAPCLQLHIKTIR